MGINVGKSASVLSGSIQANWLRQETKPDEVDLNIFLSGSRFNVSDGQWVGISSTVSPGNGSATGIGIMVPLQIGGSYNLSFQGPGNTGIKW